MQPNAECLLYSAARAQLVGEVIRPHLARGGVVVCDRYADSTLAYQGYGHGLDLETLRLITAFATGRLKPDLTLLFDVDAETGLRRRRVGGGEWNRMDDYALAFHERVRAGYLELVRAEPERWVKLDATQGVEALAALYRRASFGTWKGLRRLHCRAALKPGLNHLKVEVANLWINKVGSIPPRDLRALAETYGVRWSTASTYSRAASTLSPALVSSSMAW